MNVEMYKAVAGKLTEGVYKGFGKDIIDTKWDTPDYNMLFDLRENVYIFSAAKQYQEIRHLTTLLTKGDKINSYNDFKKQAIVIHTDYNDNYLRTEYGSAIAQSQSASKWMDIEKNAETLPNLTYHTVGDSRVRRDHAALDGITRPVADKFWNTCYPPNDWNCRCTVIQDDGALTLKKNFSDETKAAIKDIPEVFQFNAGKSRIVFSDKHPYYDVRPKDRAFAKINFNMPLPGNH